MKMFYLPKWRLFLLSVMLISGVSITAQAQGRMQVTSTVRRDQGDLLPNASVVALNEKTKYTAGVVTDSNGVFRFSGLPLEGRYSFSISYMGFEPQLDSL